MYIKREKCVEKQKAARSVSAVLKMVML